MAGAKSQSSSSTVAEVACAIDAIAPLHLAEAWDNVGLLVGARDWPVSRIMLTIDLTAAVLAETLDSGGQMILAYHPPIFQPLKTLTDADQKQLIVLEAARQGIAIHSPHTALDAAPGGVNDWLAEAFGPGDVRALQSHRALPRSEEYKLITFCPSDAVDHLRRGLAAIGAGRIGEYELCSFEIPGTGTFLGGESTNPAVGERGELQRVNEIRLEMVCPGEALGLAVLTIRQFHPYEEPPIEIYQLHARPQRSIGAGRRIMLDQKVALEELATRVREHLGVSQVRVAPPEAGAIDRIEPSSAYYETIGVCAGAGGTLIDDAIAQGCQLFLTGEMRHHDILAAQARGCAIMLAGHTNTERGYLSRLREKLLDVMPGLDVDISERDRDPLIVM